MKNVLLGLIACMSLIFGFGTDYGFGAYIDILLGLFHQVLPLVIILFVIVIFLYIFEAPAWIMKIFRGGNK